MQVQNDASKSMRGQNGVKSIICVFKSSSRIGHNFDGVLFRVIDCTGDADIAYMAGAEYRKTGELTFVERNRNIEIIRK